MIGDWVGEDWGKRVLKEWGKVDDMGMRELWGVEGVGYMGGGGMGGLELVGGSGEEVERGLKVEMGEV